LLISSREDSRAGTSARQHATARARRAGDTLNLSPEPDGMHGTIDASATASGEVAVDAVSFA
jgi:hypothetical protein